MMVQIQTSMLHLYLRPCWYHNSVKTLPQNLHKLLPQKVFQLKIDKSRKHKSGPQQISLGIHLITQEFGLIFQVNISFDVLTGRRFCSATDLRLPSAASANRNGNATEGRQVQEERSLNAFEQREITRISAMNISNAGPSTEHEPVNPNRYPASYCLLQYSISYVCLN